MKCPFSDCKFEASSLGVLKQHVVRAHVARSMSKCPFCDRPFSDAEGLRKHCQFARDLNHALLYFFLKPPRSKSSMWREFRVAVLKSLREGGVAIPCRTS
jgi:hypothetical protein